MEASTYKLPENQTNVTFDDVKGVAEAKSELEEIVMYLKNPAKFTRLGGKLPRGLLLTGPPGTGKVGNPLNLEWFRIVCTHVLPLRCKTLWAKAIAGEADVPFFFSSGSSIRRGLRWPGSKENPGTV